MKLTEKEIRAEEREYRRVQKMIEKKDAKGLDKWIVDFGRGRKIRKDDWL